MKITTVLGLSLLLAACGSPAKETEPDLQTPVEITLAKHSDMASYVDLNASATYLEKSYIKASINGYLRDIKVTMGDVVNSGQVLFILVTKEAQAIGNSINRLDPAFKFSGTSNIRAAQTGFITMVNHQKGDYVTEGETLAVLSNKSSLVFLLDVPYAMRQNVVNNAAVVLTLPDGEKLNGTIGSALATVDSVAQTQRFMIRVAPGHAIPENLVAVARLVNLFHPNAVTLPKAALLSNETEDEFWVMKLSNDSTALKVLVKKGIDDGKQVEILTPIFVSNDRFVLAGNYGLPDTAKVKIKR
ncbi:HlyD family efflux transporter periplasmic adaptor subunit [Pedobacter sp. PLR]|uniref:efflux RND transporter periplasmic adaptor subunit n=1 Tax=Pedobacter sp. PLR TaxID=2994465 RepID=UPI002246B9ED|nr:HlyD family efflux transporter periplasmic adaptor subunit [Pedobacter sp. PLR]MCX2453401.1 HlyD family efflux transporter periplasmic adaptor subunit [Pedobacter sp. PLR]